MRKMLLLGACLLLAGPAFAQSASEKTGVNSVLGIAPKTADFIKEAATSDMFEIQSSKLAAERAQGDVKSFADQMVTDHTKTTSELRSLAPGANVPLPTQMTSSAEHAGQVKRPRRQGLCNPMYGRPSKRAQKRRLFVRALQQGRGQHKA